MFHQAVLLLVLLFHFFLSPVAKSTSGGILQKDMQITSPAFPNNTILPVEYTCQGAGVNPPLVFSGVQGQTKSLALIVADPDAVGGLFVHWVVFNIPPETRTIAKNSHPVGAVESVTSYGRPGYGSPCPPNGTGVHRYIFTLYALDVVLTLTPNMPALEVEKALQGHILATSSLTGLFPEK